MKMMDMTLNLVNLINKDDSLSKKFSISTDYVASELHEIDLTSLDKKEKSFTVLILPELNIPFVQDIKKLFGDNSKGGEE